MMDFSELLKMRGLENGNSVCGSVEIFTLIILFVFDDSFSPQTCFETVKTNSVFFYYSPTFFEFRLQTTRLPSVSVSPIVRNAHDGPWEVAFSVRRKG